MEDLYPVLKMAYTDVTVISRQAGMYYCVDTEKDINNVKQRNGQGVLFVHNVQDPRGIDLLSMSFGKSWVAMMYKDKHVEIIDKRDGTILYTFSNISTMSKQNIYNDKCSTLTIKHSDSRLDKLIVIDNKRADILGIYDNVIGIKVDTRSRYEMILRMYDGDNNEIYVGISHNMRGVVLKNEA